MKNIRLVSSGIEFALYASFCHAADFGGKSWGYAWADTPQGKFECINDDSTDNFQVLKLNGRVVFRQTVESSWISEGDTLANGIRQSGVGCPSIIANERGYVVIVRDTQPPHYGVQGYAIIDFNEKEPILITLAEGQRPQDEKVARSQRFGWSAKGLRFRYFGYLPDQPSSTAGSAKPRHHELFLDFSSDIVDVTK
ncbi:hypothetical protein SAMN05518865_106303 [Duganella sp. CF458]|nr:hypothetical protein SAMN05518865_106303 [Duganella sp. CF458]